MTEQDTSTQTFAFITWLAAGRAPDYERVHQAIPAALDRAMRDAGVLRWSIHRTGLKLTHLVEARDRAHMERTLDADPVNLAWQREIAPLLGVAAEGANASPDASGVLVWDFSWPTR